MGRARGSPRLAKPGGPPYAFMSREREGMNIQYVTDEQGQKVAVVIPIKEWEAIQARGIEYADDVTPEEIAEAEAAWADHVAGKDPGTPLNQLEKELLHDTD